MRSDVGAPATEIQVVHRPFIASPWYGPEVSRRQTEACRQPHSNIAERPWRRWLTGASSSSQTTLFNGTDLPYEQIVASL